MTRRDIPDPFSTNKLNHTSKQEQSAHLFRLDSVLVHYSGRMHDTYTTHATKAMHNTHGIHTTHATHTTHDLRIDQEFSQRNK